ncbi:hypothetical protein WJ41_03180 [Burkholderia ubonensis]|uniref:hypothetical protein n=1 Tax=Burkholderia ubonensis TaxID=101571 RepID=UPI000758892E|nr:hypothetical protein [Burkholderia ubonensis]KVH78406.1 hypothetical protein WJ41_03180 [Burkholderia ubonensis]KVU09881.1 hypothetical protein WK61_24180 [Burkholderia ubonensis]KVU10031.1 hypothetical protein WK61_24985 [Burkholderia ubonensis]
MKKVWQWVEVGFALCAIGVVTVFLIYAFKIHSEGAAAWVQAICAFVGIFGAFGVARYTVRMDQLRKAAEEKVARAADLLALQHIAAELAQMCLLTNFEKSNFCEKSIYPDAADEFKAIFDLLAAFPIVNVAALGEMESLLELRRTSTFCSRIFAEDRDVTGDQFVIKHRSKFDKYHSRCMELSTHLKERVEDTAPGHFTSKLRTHL